MAPPFSQVFNFFKRVFNRFQLFQHSSPSAESFHLIFHHGRLKKQIQKIRMKSEFSGIFHHSAHPTANPKKKRTYRTEKRKQAVIYAFYLRQTETE
jgi:hypothetical protein